MNRPILRALDVMHDRLVTADAIGQAFETAGGQEAAAWVQVYRVQIEGIRQACEALETLLRGYGGCGPHGDLVQASPDLLRGQGSALPGSPSRPDQPGSELNC